MKLNLLIVCLCLCLVPLTFGEPVTLETCLQRADQRSSSLKSSEMAAEAADESLVISRASFYPTLKLRAAYSLADNPDRLIIPGNSFAINVPPRDVILSTGDHDTYSVGLYLQQPLYTGGNLTQSKRRAEFLAQAAKSDTSYQRTQVAQMVKKTFFEALAARIHVQALLKSSAGAKEQLRVVQELLLEGHADREELLTAEMDVSKAEAALAQGENRAALTLAALRNLINAAPDESIEPVGSLPGIHLTAPLNELQAIGLHKRADLISLQAKVQQGSADVAIARSGFFPQISLVGSYLRQPETATLRPDVWSIGARAEWSLFEWGRTSAEVRRATALAQQEVFRQDDARKSVLLEVEQFWRDMKDAEAWLQAEEAQLKSAEYELDKVLDRFQEGLVKKADVLKSEAALWHAYSGYVQSAGTLHTTLAGLERATGADLAPWLEYQPLHEPAFGDIALRVARASHAKLPLPGPAPASPAAVPEEEKNIIPPKNVKPAYLVQFGAFKLRENAERALKSMIRETQKPPKLTIINEQGMFKVIAGPFIKKEEAVSAATGLGAKDFLVKVTHGP